jgi:hypothetical protein
MPATILPPLRSYAIVDDSISQPATSDDTHAPQVPLSEIPHWATHYGDPADDLAVEQAGAAARARGWLTLDELKTLADWKSPRIGRHIAKNTEAEVEEVTCFALSTPSERLRIESLTLLRGVGYPMASVILHFTRRGPYPILDFRALWSLGAPPPTAPPASGYNGAFWQRYTTACRALAAEAACPLRTLDRALWAYSKANA